MDPDVHVEDIGRTRQIYFKTKSKHCSIIVKFVKYQERLKVFNGRKRLKGEGFPDRKTKSSRRSMFGNVWTLHGKILYKGDDAPDIKPAIYYQ